MQTEARIVVIGAGIAGCSVAYHLALSGWRDIVVLDQGTLFHTGGSTSHAPGGLSRISSSRMLAEFAHYSVRLYMQLEFEQQKRAALVGGLVVACTAERWQELQRRACDVVLGREPVLHTGKPVGYITSANSGYSVGRNVAYALLPAALAVPGCAVEIEYFGAALPATVAAEPLFDPDGARLRA